MSNSAYIFAVLSSINRITCLQDTREQTEAHSAVANMDAGNCHNIPNSDQREGRVLWVVIEWLFRKWPDLDVFFPQEMCETCGLSYFGDSCCCQMNTTTINCRYAGQQTKSMDDLTILYSAICGTLPTWVILPQPWKNSTCAYRLMKAMFIEMPFKLTV